MTQYAWPMYFSQWSIDGQFHFFVALDESRDEECRPLLLLLDRLCDDRLGLLSNFRGSFSVDMSSLSDLYFNDKAQNVMQKL